MLPGLAADAGFATTELVARLWVDLDPEPGGYARDYVGWIVDLAPALGVPDDKTRQWADRLAIQSTRGAFFFGLPWIGVLRVMP